MAASWTGPGVLPPPPGVQPNFIDPPDQQTTTIAIHTVFLTLATACMGIRLYTRQFINHSLGIDDYCCLFGYCNALVFSGLIIWGETQGLGRHLWDVLLTQLPTSLKALTIAEYFYLIAAAFIKLSCLLFYRRVFTPDRKILGFVWAGIAFVALSYTITLFITIFECWPLEKNWNEAIQGHCLPPKGLPYASGVINVVSDIYVLIMPIPAIWSLNLKTARKFRTIALFCLGFFVCITSIIRLAMTPVLYNSLDATWNLLEISVWAVIEIDVGVICACLLAFPAFIEHHKTSRVGSYISRLVSTLTRSRIDSTQSAKTTKKIESAWQSKTSDSIDKSAHEHRYEELSDRQLAKPKASSPRQINGSVTSQDMPLELAYGQSSRRDVYEMRGVGSQEDPHTIV